MLSEISQAQKEKYLMLLSYVESRKKNERKKRMTWK